MAERRRFRVAGGALAALLVGLPAASSAGQDSTVIVHLEDQVRMPPTDVEMLKTNVDEIFQGAGVWVSWAGPLGRPVSDVACDGFRHVAVAIIDIQQPFSGDARDTDDVLGRAAPAYARAWVFLNRIAAAAKDRPVDVNLLVARAIAHELGHLLLPPATRHAAVGLMRPGLELNHVGMLRFTREESRSMRAALEGTGGQASNAPARRCR